MNKQVVSIPVELIDVPERLRELDPNWATLIAESFKERGQDTPIRVTVADTKGRHRLIAGLHRYEAAKLAEWPRIDAICFDGTDLQAELLEIDENLIRRELSELDRATFLARRKQVWEALHPAVRHGGKRAGGQVAKVGDLLDRSLEQRFSAEAAKKLGLSERSIQRAVARYGAIVPDVRRRLANHRIAQRGAELDALAAFEADQQRSIADALLADTGAPGSVREVSVRLGFAQAPAIDPVRQQFNALLNAWGRNDNPRAQRQFLDHLAGDKKTRKQMETALGRVPPAEDDEA